jgi:hypothetical protein
LRCLSVNPLPRSVSSTVFPPFTRFLPKYSRRPTSGDFPGTSRARQTARDVPISGRPSPESVITHQQLAGELSRRVEIPPGATADPGGERGGAACDPRGHGCITGFFPGSVPTRECSRKLRVESQKSPHPPARPLFPSMYGGRQAIGWLTLAVLAARFNLIDDELSTRDVCHSFKRGRLCGRRGSCRTWPGLASGGWRPVGSIIHGGVVGSRR